MIFILLLLFLTASASDKLYADKIKQLNDNMDYMYHEGTDEIIYNYQEDTFIIHDYKLYVDKILETIQLLNELWNFSEKDDSFAKLSFKQKRFFNYFLDNCKKKINSAEMTVINIANFYITISASNNLENKVKFFSNINSNYLFESKLELNEFVCKKVFSLKSQNDLENLYTNTKGFLDFYAKFLPYIQKSRDQNSRFFKVLAESVANSDFFQAFLSSVVFLATPHFHFDQNKNENDLYQLRISDSFENLNTDITFLRDIRPSLFISFDDQKKQDDYDFLSEHIDTYQASIVIRPPRLLNVDSIGAFEDKYLALTPLLTTKKGKEYIKDTYDKTLVFESKSDFDEWENKVNIPIEYYLATIKQDELTEEMCKKVEKDIDKLMKHWYHNEIKNTASNLREKLADQKKLQKDLDHKRKLKKTGMVLGVAGVVAIASYLGYKNRSQLLSLYHTFMKPNK